MPETGARRSRASARAVLFFALLAASCRGPAPAPEEVEEFSTELRFQGAELISEDDLRDALADEIDAAHRRGFRKADVDDVAFEVERYYRQRGYHFVVVAYDYPGDETATIRIVEGTRVRVGDLEFPGVAVYAPSELSALLRARRELLGFGSRIFVQTEVEALRRAVADLYFERGYREVRVEDPVVEFSSERDLATVSIRVTEGRQHVLASVDLSSLSGVDLESLRERLAYLDGSAFAVRLLKEVASAVEEEYARVGHPYARAQVTDSVRETAERVDHVFGVEADPGPAVAIRKVVVGGNRKASTAFVVGRVQLKAGDRFDGDRFRESFRELYETGLFRSVDLRLVETGETNEAGLPLRDILVEVDETSTLEYFFEVGFGSYDLARGKAGVRERNLLGRGMIGRAELLGSIRGAEATVGVTVPSLLDSEWELDVPVTALYREEPSFTVFESGVGARLARPLTENVLAGLSYRFRVSDLESDRREDLPFRADENLRLGAAGPFLEFDSRNDFFMPTSGVRWRVFSEWGSPELGSEIAFVHAGASSSHYFELFAGTVIASTIQTEWIIPVDGTDEIPIQERLFLGGENGVRSFEQSEVGPLDARGKPVGGEVRNFVSVELRQEIWQNIALTAFGDYGNVAIDDSEPFDDFRPGVGAGILYRLPIGPLRADFAFNPDRKSGEESFVVHFAVGMAY